jgi:hypothetical protein
MKNGSNVAFVAFGGWWMVGVYRLLAEKFPELKDEFISLSEFYSAPFGKSLVAVDALRIYRLKQGKENTEKNYVQTTEQFKMLYTFSVGIFMLGSHLGIALTNASFFFLGFTIANIGKILSLVPVSFDAYNYTPVPSELIDDINKAFAESQI